MASQASDYVAPPAEVGSDAVFAWEALAFSSSLRHAVTDTKLGSCLVASAASSSVWPLAPARAWSFLMTVIILLHFLPCVLFAEPDRHEVPCVPSNCLGSLRRRFNVRTT